MNTHTKVFGIALFMALGMGVMPVAALADNCEDIEIEDFDIVDTEVGENVEIDTDLVEGEAENFSVDFLPEGLEIDEDTGEISGEPEEAGIFVTEVTAENDCSEDTETIRFDIDEDEDGNGGSGYDVEDPNVNLEGELIRADGTSVSLDELPYTGFGSTLQTVLMVSALSLWAAFLVFLALGARGREAATNLVFATSGRFSKDNEEISVIDRFAASTAFAPETEVRAETEDPMLLQSLRARAHESRVLFSEEALALVADEAEDYDEDPNMLIDRIVEKAAASYPREDGYIKLNASRTRALLG